MMQAPVRGAVAAPDSGAGALTRRCHMSRGFDRKLSRFSCARLVERVWITSHPSTCFVTNDSRLCAVAGNDEH
jgi:hypothetical protein